MVPINKANLQQPRIKMRLGVAFFIYYVIVLENLNERIKLINLLTNKNIMQGQGGLKP